MREGRKEAGKPKPQESAEGAAVQELPRESAEEATVQELPRESAEGATAQELPQESAEGITGRETQESIGETAAQKAALRRQMKQQRAGLSDRERRHAGASCAMQLRQLPEFVRCDILLAYMSHGAELPTEGIIAEALERGMRVAVPRVTGPGTMEFYEIGSLSECAPGAYGIPEPEVGGERLVFLEEFESAAALLPGLAFTKGGARLGYGGGYYDRYFSKHRKVYRIGLTYGFALVEHLPCEPHDIRADVVLAPVLP